MLWISLSQIVYAYQVVAVSNNDSSAAQFGFLALFSASNGSAERERVTWSSQHEYLLLLLILWQGL